MLACRGQPHERVQAGLDALRSEDYRLRVSATSSERAILMMQGLSKDTAKDWVPKPPVERLPGATKLRPWLIKRLADIQARRVDRGSVKYVLAVYPPDLADQQSWYGLRISLRLVEMDQDFARRRDRKGYLAWPTLRDPGVLRVIAEFNGVYWGKTAASQGKRCYAEMLEQKAKLERQRWERSAEQEVVTPAIARRPEPLRLEML